MAYELALRNDPDFEASEVMQSDLSLSLEQEELDKAFAEMGMK
jgi:hypothetical protein